MVDLPKPPPIKDACPRWAVGLIEQIGALEVRLGNIRPSGEWKAANIQELINRLSDDSQAESEAAVEATFRQVAKGLLAEGHDAAAVAAFVNARIPSGRLPYCSAAEVLEAAREAGPTSD